METGLFLADVATLRTQAAEVCALDMLRACQRDRLTYRQQKVDQGLAERDTLWTETEAAQHAEQDSRRVAGKLEVQRLTRARWCGDAERGRLEMWVEAMRG